MIRLPPRSTLTDPLFPYTRLFRSARAETPFDAGDGPVLQVVFSGGTAKAWEEGTAGLSARDIAMNVALPEVDGRLLTRAVSFKGAARWDAATQTSVVAYERSEERRVGEEWVRTGRSWGWTEN